VVRTARRNLRRNLIRWILENAKLIRIARGLPKAQTLKRKTTINIFFKERIRTMKSVGLIGAPSSAGARQTGQELAPKLLRTMGICEDLHSAGLRVLDYGDIPLVGFEPDTNHPKAQNSAKVLGAALMIADKVSKAVQQEVAPLVIGGDCTVTLGVLEGLRRHYDNLGLVYFDGDVDLNTPETTKTGILDGMVLAHIIGKGVDALSQIGNHSPLVAERDVILFGYNARAGWMDPAEKEFLLDSSFLQYSVTRIRGRASQMATEVLSSLNNNVKHFLVHFDVDVIDFSDLPVADVPHERGLNLQEAADALGVFVSSPRCAGLVVTEFNAERDPDGVHAKRLIKEIARILAPSQM
jgi:arginase